MNAERGVVFSGTLETGYRACLWSRTASRVLLQLAEFEAASADEFYRQVRAFDWSAHIDPARTIACEFTGVHPTITHSHFGALRLKDGVCDRLRDDAGARPDVELSRPAVRLHAHASGTRVALSLDLAGEGLHRRGYRTEAGEAPLRENLAAGVLLRARWPEAAERGGRIPRSAVRLGHAGDRSGDDRGAAGAGIAPRLFRLSGLEGPRCRAVAAPEG